MKTGIVEHRISSGRNRVVSGRRRVMVCGMVAVATVITAVASAGRAEADEPSGVPADLVMMWNFTRNFGLLCGNDDFENYAGIIYVS